MRKQIYALIIAAILCISLTGCTFSENPDSSFQPEIQNNQGFQEQIDTEKSERSDKTETDQLESQNIDPTEYLIWGSIMELKTTEFDEFIYDLPKTVQTHNGFIEKAIVDNNPKENDEHNNVSNARSAQFFIRVPSENLTELIQSVSDLGEVIRWEQTAANITSQYINNEEKLGILREREARMMARIDTMTTPDDIIKLEAELANIRTEIESVEKNIRDIKTMTNYSTLQIDVKESKYAPKIIDPNKSFGQNFWAGIKYQASWIADSISIVILTLIASPYLSVALIAIPGITLYCKIRKKYPKHKSSETTSEPEDNHTDS